MRPLRGGSIACAQGETQRQRATVRCGAPKPSHLRARQTGDLSALHCSQSHTNLQIGANWGASIGIDGYNPAVARVEVEPKLPRRDEGQHELVSDGACRGPGCAHLTAVQFQHFHHRLHATVSRVHDFSPKRSRQHAFFMQDSQHSLAGLVGQRQPPLLAAQPYAFRLRELLQYMNFGATFKAPCSRRRQRAAVCTGSVHGTLVRRHYHAKPCMAREWQRRRC